MTRARDGFDTGRDRAPGFFPALGSVPGLAHGVSERGGPDFSAPVGAPAHAAAAGELAASIGLGEAAWMRQVHGNTVCTVESGGLQGEADALVTTRPGLALLGRSADCPLVLAAGPLHSATGAGGARPTAREETRAADARAAIDPDTASRAAGIAHASWRGTVLQVAVHMVQALLAASNLRPDELLAAIAPSAGPCCYEVGEEVREAALAGIGPHAGEFFALRESRLFFDLWRANADQLHRLGVPERNIHVAGVCTLCRNDLYPSHRLEGSAAGRFAAAVGWRA